MLRYKTETRPGLVALYDIRPGNGAGQFLQPRSPHGALLVSNSRYGYYAWVETKVIVRIFQDPLSLSLSGGPGLTDSRMFPFCILLQLGWWRRW